MSAIHRDEVDDYTFLNHPQQGSSGYLLGGSSDPASDRSWSERKQQLLEERRRIEDRTLESSKASLSALYQAEASGMDTAAALIHQREQLENTEKNLDTINSMMRQSQKHLTAMKSIFGGLKSMFSKNNDPNVKALPAPAPEYRSRSSLASNLESLRSQSVQKSADNHPALASRGLDSSGFRFDDDDVTAGKDSNGYDQRSKIIDQQLDHNLEEIGSGLSRLKHLALGLSEEIDEHNEILPRIQAKAERADNTLHYQNRQINQQLRK